jgi:hypothetical protein
MTTNLLFQIIKAPEVLQMVVAFLEPHNLSKIRRTVKALTMSIPSSLLFQCRTDTRAKYSRAQRMADGALRVYSEFGTQTYDIRRLLNEEPKNIYSMRSARGSFRGRITRGDLFEAKEIHIINVYFIESDGRTLICTKLEFPDGQAFNANLHFSPHAEEA